MALWDGHGVRAVARLFQAVQAVGKPIVFVDFCRIFCELGFTRKIDYRNRPEMIVRILALLQWPFAVVKRAVSLDVGDVYLSRVLR